MLRRPAALAAVLAALALATPAHASAPSLDCVLTACPPLPVDAYDSGIDLHTLGPLVAAAGGSSGTNTDSYPEIRNTSYIGVPLSGVTSPHGGVVAIEHVLHDSRVDGGAYYLPCKAAPTEVPDVPSPFGGEPYKAACQDPENPSYFRSAAFGAGRAQTAPSLGHLLTVDNVTTNANCSFGCHHDWGNRTSVIAVEIYLKKTVNGSLVTDFDYVRPRFNASGFSRRYSKGLTSVNYGIVRPLRAYERGTARLQGYVYSSGRTLLTGANRLVFSVFENEANGRTSTGQPLQAFSAFKSNGGYYTTGTVYSGTYRFKVRDTQTGKCVLAKMLRLRTMGERVDMHLDQKAFGIPGAAEVRC